MVKRLILASSSPRRREILDTAGYEYDVCPSDADEYKNAESAEALVRENALLKAQGVFKKLGDKNAVVLGADTVVCVDGEILGKPKDARDAKDMLLKLSGSSHEVITGFAVVTEASFEAYAVTAKVKFRELSEEEIDSYVATGEPLDKAGAYGIQERGCILAERVEGDFFTIIGLPISAVYPVLKKHGILPK